MKDLAPQIHRQRLIIEGKCLKPINADKIKEYLVKLSDILKMITLNEPITHKSSKYGWAGWIHWESSGAHFYAWDQPLVFFSIDIYTCKEFIDKDAVDFTKDFFNATEIEFKSV
jgi:hypothetical protein